MIDEEEGYADLAPSITVRLAAGLHAVSGLYLALSAVQLLISLRFYGELAVMQYLNWALVAVGAAQIYVAAQLVRMRAPYGVVAVVLGFVVALLTTGWVVANISFTVFSCMQIFALLFAWHRTRVHTGRRSGEARGGGAQAPRSRRDGPRALRAARTPARRASARTR